jgi:hypothetical protein
VLESVDWAAPMACSSCGRLEGGLLTPTAPSHGLGQLGVAQDAGTEDQRRADPAHPLRQGRHGPTFFIDQVEKRMCANGQVVERVDLAEATTPAAVPAYAQAMDWLRLFADKDVAKNTCSE